MQDCYIQALMTSDCWGKSRIGLHGCISPSQVKNTFSNFLDRVQFSSVRLMRCERLFITVMRKSAHIPVQSSLLQQDCSYWFPLKPWWWINILIRKVSFHLQMLMSVCKSRFIGRDYSRGKRDEPWWQNQSVRGVIDQLAERTRDDKHKPDVRPNYRPPPNT